jgi:hypothetical protein
MPSIFSHHIILPLLRDAFANNISVAVLRNGYTGLDLTEFILATQNRNNSDHLTVPGEPDSHDNNTQANLGKPTPGLKARQMFLNTFGSGGAGGSGSKGAGVSDTITSTTTTFTNLDPNSTVTSTATCFTNLDPELGQSVAAALAAASRPKDQRESEEEEEEDQEEEKEREDHLSTNNVGNRGM